MIALLLLALRQTPAHGPEPGPRAALAGIAGFQTVSKVDFGTARNRLTAAYIFPDRTRWHFEAYDPAEGSAHQLFYRSGERVCALASGASTEMEGTGRDSVILQMELRRAAMLWPDGVDWHDEEGGSRRAAVHGDSCCRERLLGALVATSSPGGPLRIEVRGASDQVLEALEVRTWQQHAGRTWPRELALLSDQGGFVETVETIETRVHYLDLSFLPPDRRPLPASDPGPTVLARDVVAMTYAVHPLPDGATWDEALARARREIQLAGERLRPAGLTVDPVPTLELSAQGRPTHCLVRLASPTLPAPAGFVTRPERAGLFSPLAGLSSVDENAIRRLTAALPAGVRAESPYLRVHDRPEVPVELVLPLRADD